MAGSSPAMPASWSQGNTPPTGNAGASLDLDAEMGAAAREAGAGHFKCEPMEDRGGFRLKGGLAKPLDGRVLAKPLDGRARTNRNYST